jgi:hypothetical protein
MLIDSTDPSAIAKPNRRLIKLLIRAHRFHATLIGSPGVPFSSKIGRFGDNVLELAEGDSDNAFSARLARDHDGSTRADLR